LEQAICSNMNREVGPAKNLAQQALEQAKAHGYIGFYLRALTTLATLESEVGDETSAWAAIQEGLSTYWQLDTPPLRAYSFYALLETMASRVGHPNVQFAATLEALDFGNPSRLMEASERVRLGDLAFRLGDVRTAESQLDLARQAFDDMFPTAAVRWRQLEVQLWLAHVQALRSSDTRQAEAALSVALPEIERLSNRYLEYQYYDILADLKIRSGDAIAGQDLLVHAISVAEGGLQSLSTWQERAAWTEQHRLPYISLAELLIRSGDSKSSLSVWEHFRLADGDRMGGPTTNLWRSNFVSFSLASDALPDTQVITYAFSRDGVLIWFRHAGEIHSAYLRVQPRDILRAAENLISECSRPDSDFSNLHADARYLYQWLIEPVSRWLPPTGHIIVEPDGILGVVPMEALMDGTGSYLGSRYTITVASSVQGGSASGRPAHIQKFDRALIAAAPATQDGSLKPATGTIKESLRVAKAFSEPTTLIGTQVQLSRVGHDLVRASVFHFAGHAGLSRSGAAMLLADGILGTYQARILAGHQLGTLKLAFFSACGTAKPSEMSDADSLVTVFLHAGAQNVVASRWNVDSIATTDFVDLFYSSLLSGASVADALQGAAATFRKMPERAHPYYWAAFGAFGRV